METTSLAALKTKREAIIFAMAAGEIHPDEADLTTIEAYIREHDAQARADWEATKDWAAARQEFLV